MGMPFCRYSLGYRHDHFGSGEPRIITTCLRAGQILTSERCTARSDAHHASMTGLGHRLRRGGGRARRAAAVGVQGALLLQLPDHGLAALAPPLLTDLHAFGHGQRHLRNHFRSEEHTSELPSLMRTSYAV